jgi:hypothetical protein
MARIDLLEKLAKHKLKNAAEADRVLSEAKRILNAEAFRGKNILSNLKGYAKLTEVLEEDVLDEKNIFTLAQIRAIAINYRLRFVKSECYKFEYPYESVLKIDYLNQTHHKNLKGFKVLASADFFKKEKNKDHALLFAPTDHGNYYLVHKWGEPYPAFRKYKTWPLRNIEPLFLTVMIFTLIVTMSLPTYLITLDRKATYWCHYRIGIYFHLLIFFMGFTTYFAFAFSRGLSVMNWDRDRDF